MGSADWSLALGTLVMIVAVVFAIYYYVRYRKIYLVCFVASIATYIFAVFYTWDVFEFNKNQILVMLAISTILMMGLGKYFSNLSLTHKKKK